MTVREALEKATGTKQHVRHDLELLDDLAPKIEAALRAAYEEGAMHGKMLAPHRINPEHGVTAGIEAMQ